MPNSGASGSSANDGTTNPSANSSGTGSPPTSTQQHSLCDSCTSAPGGQTSDFDSPPCPTEPHPITDEQKLAFGVAEIVAATSKPFELSMQWGRAPTEGIARLTAESETTIEGTIELGTFSYVSAKEGYSCADGVSAPVTVTFSTRDGAIAAQTHGELGRGRNYATWSVGSSVDLSEVTGTLDLQLDPTRIAQGSLGLSISGMPSGLRGQLTIGVTYYDSEEQLAEAPTLHARHQPVGEDVRGLPEGVFPVDGCWIDSFPIDAQSPHPWLGGESPASMFALARSAFGASSSFDAQWGDGSKTRVTIDMGEPPSGTVCMVDYHPEQVRLDFAGAGRIRSDDGRIDAPLSQATLYSTPLMPEIQSMAFVTETPRQPAAGFEQASGIDGFDAAGNATLRSFISVARDTDPIYDSVGNVSVMGIDSSLVACLVWPVTGPINSHCDPVVP